MKPEKPHRILQTAMAASSSAYNQEWEFVMIQKGNQGKKSLKSTAVQPLSKRLQSVFWPVPICRKSPSQMNFLGAGFECSLLEYAFAGNGFGWGCILTNARLSSLFATCQTRLSCRSLLLSSKKTCSH